LGERHLWWRDPGAKRRGLLLGDGHLTISSTSKNASLVFIQTINRFKYAWHIYELLSFLCQSAPRVDKSTRKGKISYNVRIQTRTYKFLTLLHTKFYVNKVKVIPDDLLNWRTRAARWPIG